MKQQKSIILACILLLAVMVVIDLALVKQKAKEPDTEDRPNRSTFNSGATGSQALFEVLSESGRKVTRWKQPMSFLTISKNAPQTFVIIGMTRDELKESEVQQILNWVSNGGKLVLIDRSPNTDFLKTTSNWSIENIPDGANSEGVEPSSQTEMTANSPAVKPTQVSIYTTNINAVQPSRFVSNVKISHGKNIAAEPINEESENEPPPTAIPLKPNEKTIETPANFDAPFVHLASEKKNILVDFPFGAGQIVVLTDPYIVSNGGISQVDNLQLATNVIGSREGIIAFDEFHQGYGSDRGTIFGYFAGTPVIPVFIQICLLVSVLFWSQSRRFARAMPVPLTNRLTKLEYISAMAALQKRTKAFDLAIDNIFSEFRRSTAKLFALDTNASLDTLAKAIAERTKFSEHEIYQNLSKCQEIIRGEPTDKRETLELTAELRKIEEKLGIRRTRKETFGK